MADLSGGDGVDQAGHRRPMAPSGISSVFAAAIEIRAAISGKRDSRSDSADEWRQPALAAPWIHGELLKLGIELSQATVTAY